MCEGVDMGIGKMGNQPSLSFSFLFLTIVFANNTVFDVLIIINGMKKERKD